VAVKIRLERIGAKGQPSYRVVIVDERAARSGRNIEIVGHYNPLVEPSSFTVDKDKIMEWMKKGAQPTETVRKLLGKIGVLKAVDFTNRKKKASKSKEGAKEETAAAPAEQKPA
jgi:small subunit ribosomal protein S16